MTKDDLITLLSSGKKSNIKKATNFLMKNDIDNEENIIVNSFSKYFNQKAFWESNVEILKIIELKKFHTALKLINDIVKQNIEYDLVTIYSAKVFGILNSQSIEDVSPVKELMIQCNYSVGYGILDYLGYYKIIPKEKEQEEILKHFWNFSQNRAIGYVDARYGLAAACAGWKNNLVIDFLNNCIKTGDEPLKYVATNSLKGKYVKLR